LSFASAVMFFACRAAPADASLPEMRDAARRAEAMRVAEAQTQTSQRPAAAEHVRASDLVPEPPHDSSQVYGFIGIVNNQPRLDSAAKEIDRQINRPFRLLAPGFDDVRTFEDQRDDMAIWNVFGGVGHVLSERWDAFFQAGYAAGEVRTQATDASWLLAPLHTEVTLERSSAFVGPGLAYYPWGMVERREYESWADRLKKAKPFATATISFNYLTFEADVKAGPVPFKRLLRKTTSEQWRLWSGGLSLGLDIPATERSVLSLNGQYTFFVDHADDFSGPAFNLYWKRFF